MRFIPLVKLPDSGLAIPRIGGIRLAGQSSENSFPVYVGAFNAYVAGDPSLAAHVSGVFGDGRDGAVHYTVDTTLAADVRATTIVVDEGVRVIQNGFLQVASVSLLNNGIISDDGLDDGDHLTENSSGIAGGIGSGTAPQGSPTSNIHGTFLTFEQFGAKGGDGGGVGYRLGGDNSTSWTIVSGALSPFATNDPTHVQRIDFTSSTFLTLTVGCGGGMGGGTGAGDGGRGGRLIRLRAPQIINNGIISAKGANGKNGNAGINPNANGGGGGGGGRIIIYGKLLVTGTLNVSGGLGGNRVGTGVNGQPGEDGTIHLFGA